MAVHTQQVSGGGGKPGSEKDVASVIPNHAGLGTHRQKIQRRTLVQWTLLALTGVGLFSNRIVELSPKARAAALSIVFPGAGYIACCNLTGFLLLLLTFALIPLCLFAWFGAGGLFFPLALWSLSIPFSYLASGDSVFEQAGYVSIALLFAFFAFCNRMAAGERRSALKQREARNTYLPQTIEKINDIAVQAPPDSEREVSLEDLRDFQYLIDCGLKPLDDFSDYTIIDQFQTSAIRYQLYESMFVISTFMGIYAPNFRGYNSEAFRNFMEKSLLTKVLGFWKWETLWGKFKTDYEPVGEDNIMVSGFMLQAVMLYTILTGDERYTKPGSLKLRITDKHVYPHSVHSLSESLVRQWSNEPYCLIPCEPNWIYTMCNLQGMTGQVLYDRHYGTNHAEVLRARFKQSLEENFTEIDGRVLTIRSQLTGFTIPGIAGALNDLIIAMLCRGSNYLEIAERAWAIFRQEHVEFNEESKELKIKDLTGADYIDVGNYKPSKYALYAILAGPAGEYGDEGVRTASLAMIEEHMGKVTVPAGRDGVTTGATTLRPESRSFIINNSMIKAKLLRRGDWSRLILEGPSKTTLAGPVLEKVPYPGVLVAKARSHTGRDLDVVLYPSAEAGEFQLDLSHLVSGQTYQYAVGVDGAAAVEEKGANRLVAGEKGTANISIRVSGKTTVKLTPVSN